MNDDGLPPRTRVLLVVLFAASIVVALAVAAHAGPRYTPDHRKTPGDIITTDAKTVCVPGYATGVRNLYVSEQTTILNNYKRKSCGAGTCVFDHLIPLELGGSNSIANVWPQAYTGPWNSLMKDALEDRLHALVCNGKMTMLAAQKAVKGDWRTAYKKLFPAAPPKMTISNDTGE